MKQQEMYISNAGIQWDYLQIHKQVLHPIHIFSGDTSFYQSIFNLRHFPKFEKVGPNSVHGLIGVEDDGDDTGGNI